MRCAFSQHPLQDNHQLVPKALPPPKTLTCLLFGLPVHDCNGEGRLPVSMYKLVRGVIRSVPFERNGLSRTVQYLMVDLDDISEARDYGRLVSSLLTVTPLHPQTTRETALAA
jgi:hypothetical protein